MTQRRETESGWSGPIAKLAIEAERQIRNAKTERLREQRLLVEAAIERPAPAERRPAAVKNTQRRNIKID